MLINAMKDVGDRFGKGEADPPLLCSNRRA